MAMSAEAISSTPESPPIAQEQASQRGIDHRILWVMISGWPAEINWIHRTTPCTESAGGENAALLIVDRLIQLISGRLQTGL
jgi:hypothetical protein